jgi:hypothetical protein
MPNVNCSTKLQFNPYITGYMHTNKLNKNYYNKGQKVTSSASGDKKTWQLISHSSKGEEGFDLFWPLFSYASDVDLLRNRKDSLVPEK